MRFPDRQSAGALLASELSEFDNRGDVLVLGLPRGGVPVAFEVAQALRAPLDVLVVRKIGAPMQPEYALGAVASGDVIVWNDDALPFKNSPDVRDVVARERRELARRETLYRGEREPVRVEDKTVILVDDGAATGATMLAAVRAVRVLRASTIVVALPVASVAAYDSIAEVADRTVCLATPEPFDAVGEWYIQFDQTADSAVIELLKRSNSLQR